MTRARAVTASIAAGIAYAIGMTLVIAFTIAVLPIAAWQHRKACR